MKTIYPQNLSAYALVGALALTHHFASAANLAGSVQGAAQPIAGAAVTLYAAGAGAPTQLAQAKTDDQGTFKLTYDEAPADSVLYLIARGGTPLATADKGPNDAIALLAVLGGTPPKSIVVNEFSTVASVWTSAQFLQGEVLSGTKLGQRIAAGNVPNLVDLETGGLGPVIQDPLNSSQTPTLATFSTLGNVWVANATGRSVTHLCGARPENRPPGTKTGDPLSPPGGYTGGLQILTDLAIDPAGNVWVANNWDLPEEAGFKKAPPAALSTRFGGNGTVVFFGLAKPVRTPLIGPVRQP